jgi:DMSO reductase family type II enzyme chaperone
MAPVAARDAAVTEALARSALYALLARAFRYPTPGTAAALAAAAPAGVLARDVEAAVEAVAAAAAATDDAALAEAHVAVFGHVTLADCPLYETACGVTDPFQQAQGLADLAGFYRAFGVTVAPEAGERADHLAVELEFMHYLAYREAYARTHHGADAVDGLREAQSRFLEAHLARWAPVVARAVAARADGVLAAAAVTLERVLADECARWRIEPPAPLLSGIPLEAHVLAGREDGDEWEEP